MDYLLERSFAALAHPISKRAAWDLESVRTGLSCGRPTPNPVWLHRADGPRPEAPSPNHGHAGAASVPRRNSIRRESLRRHVRPKVALYDDGRHVAQRSERVAAADRPADHPDVPLGQGRDDRDHPPADHRRRHRVTRGWLPPPALGADHTFSARAPLARDHPSITGRTVDVEEKARREQERLIRERERLRFRVYAAARGVVLGTELFRSNFQLHEPEIVVCVYPRYVDVNASLTEGQLRLLPATGRSRDLRRFAEELRVGLEKAAVQLELQLTSDPSRWGGSEPVALGDAPCGYRAVLLRSGRD